MRKWSLIKERPVDITNELTASDNLRLLWLRLPALARCLWTIIRIDWVMYQKCNIFTWNLWRLGHVDKNTILIAIELHWLRFTSLPIVYLTKWLLKDPVLRKTRQSDDSSCWTLIAASAVQLLVQRERGQGLRPTGHTSLFWTRGLHIWCLHQRGGGSWKSGHSKEGWVYSRRDDLNFII